MARPLYEIAEEIRKDWKKIGYEAKPYVDAMASLDTIKDTYGWDSGENVVLYFLDNAKKWKGDTAEKIKKELQELVDTK